MTKIHMLVVDGLPENREAAERYLSTVDEVTVDYANDYRSAATKLQERVYACVLTDLFIPEIEGQEYSELGEAQFRDILSEIQNDTGRESACENDTIYACENEAELNEFVSGIQNHNRESISKFLVGREWRPEISIEKLNRGRRPGEYPLGALIARQCEKWGIYYLIVTDHDLDGDYGRTLRYYYLDRERRDGETEGEQIARWNGHWMASNLWLYRGRLFAPDADEPADEPIPGGKTNPELWKDAYAHLRHLPQGLWGPLRSPAWRKWLDSENDRVRRQPKDKWLDSEK